MRVLVRDENGKSYKGMNKEDIKQYTAVESRKTPVYEDCHLCMAMMVNDG